MDKWKNRYYLHLEKENRWQLVKNKEYQFVYFISFFEGKKACDFLNAMLNSNQSIDFEDFKIRQGLTEASYYVTYNSRDICYLTTYSEAKSLLRIIEEICNNSGSK